MSKKRYLTAREAATELGITPATLYAYVSRGMIRSESTGGDIRSRRYSAEDVERLKARKESRRNPEVVAEAALHLGTPVLESAVTLIHDNRLFYRGHDAIALAETASLEEVVALIWTGDLSADTSSWFSTPLEVPPALAPILESMHDKPLFDRFQVLLPILAADDFSAYDLRPANVAATGAHILRLMAWVTGGMESKSEGITSIIARLTDDPKAESLIRAALILCADHELNVSAFTARCVASAQATPYAVVIAGLAALSGAKHGGHTERVESFLREAGSPEGVYETMAGRLRRGEAIPGFGHMLYTEGDPRGRALLRLVREAYPDSPSLAFADAGEEAARRLLGEHPTIDWGLVILCRALGLPRGMALALFGMGRTIGWIGHAIEQYQADRMIRPRARYIGVQP